MKLHGDYAAFRDRLFGSEPAVRAVRDWIERKGRKAWMSRTTIYPAGGDPLAFTDSGDITVLDLVRGPLRVEVKHLPRHGFTGPQDWPFREIFVSSVGAVDRFPEPAAAYVTVNDRLSHAAILLGETKSRWYAVERLARNSGRMERYYAAPLGCIVYRRIGI